ncbi:amidase [Paracoccus sediminicola]|uniref:amidase n=1 Tax=Paracoccus sediminicola TaxID=3017783 RepID=UPI0022F04C94|nr:amidase [Paracoccus sediminicola]WBU56511.1 amidase [Paracoccus sediminicola]
MSSRDHSNEDGVTRRHFLNTSAGLATATTVGLKAGRVLAQSAPGEVTDLGVVDLVAAIRGKELSCREVMEAYLSRIDRVNPIYNAIITRQDPDALMAAADQADRSLAAGDELGALHGVPQAPKDLTATSDMPTTQGSPILKDNLPAADSVLVERTRRAGAIFVGKTNTPEFGLGSHTYNTLFGVTRNAWDPALSAGGSSGGAAVALAQRMLPVADGSDMMGSLRNPAGWNNVVGFRATQGTVPYAPSGELFMQQLGYEGPMGRTVADTAYLLSVQAGYDARAPLSRDLDPLQFRGDLSADMSGKRIGYLGDLGGYLPMEPGVLDVCEAALTYFESAGCTVEAATIDFDMATLWQTWLTLRGFLVAGNAGALYANEDTRAQLKPEAVWEVENGLKLSGADIYRASANRSAFYLAMNAMFEDYDYLVLPTAQIFPFDAEMDWPKQIAGTEMDSYHRWMEVVIPGTLSGMPVLAVPAGFGPQGDSQPMGLQIIGPRLADLSVLQIGHAYEQASGYAANRPG